MSIPGNLLTTAMAVMPHRDVDRAMELALSFDIPFWPQLPLYSYHEDMYVQASEHFPGIVLDMEKRTLRFSLGKFMAEVEETMAHFEEPEYFDISEAYSVVYHKFLDRGGVLAWGIVPTNLEPFEKEDTDSLVKRLTDVWAKLEGHGIDRDFLLSRSLLSPATCCLVNPDGEKTVNKAFRVIKELSERLRRDFDL